MKNWYSIRSHPSEDVLEEYAFHRLTEEQKAFLEEHLLICEPCQTALAEIDEFRASLKTNATLLASPRFKERIKSLWSGLWNSSSTRLRLAWAISGALAGFLLLAYVTLRQPDGATATLISMRGNSDINNAIHAPARRPLDLQMPDLTSANGSSYRIEIVDLSGKRVWGGPPSLKNGNIQVSLPKGLPKGLFWFRLYSPRQLEYEVTLRTE